MGRLAEPLRFRGILWDLDGTLVETRRDIAAGVNLALAERGLPPMSVAAVSRNVGRGSRVLMALCLGQSGAPEPAEEEIDAATGAFVRHYLDHLLDSSAPYPGVPELLERLEESGAVMGVVTNKPQEPASLLAEGLGLTGRFRFILGMGPDAERKPHPGPVREAIIRLGIPPGSCALVGDSLVDIEAARAAGIAVAAVGWGYTAGAELRGREPDFLAGSVAELESWLRGQAF